MRRMSRYLVIAFASILVASGCGTIEVVEDEPTTTSGSSAAATQASSTTTVVKPSTTVEATSSSTHPPRPPLVDGPLAPDLTLDLDDHTTLRLAEAYEPVVLFFWATWCHNCHEMMPMIDQMAGDFDDQATVVAVARLSPVHEVENDVIEYLPSGATRWALDEDSSISEAFRVPGNPVAILVVGGVEVDRWLGSTPVIDIETRLDEVLALYG